MNSVNFKIAKSFIKNILLTDIVSPTKGLLFVFFFFVQVKVQAEDKIAMIPPVTEVNIAVPTPALIERPAAYSAKQKDNEILQAIRKAVQPVEPTNEIVVLNTENGFVPNKIRVKKGEAYKIHVVNLNMKEKNVSFLMDAFTQSHNTVYGNKTSFNIEPQVEGIYSYQCPETGQQGQLTVVKDVSPDEKRKIASDAK